MPLQISLRIKIVMKKPDWLRIPYTDKIDTSHTVKILSDLKLNTVCIEAACPNCNECFSQDVATFLILGSNCTRNCGFCNIRYAPPETVDENEPMRIAEAVTKLNLKYVVITSVTRDDLHDGGAEHFAKTISAIRQISPKTQIEVLIPDFGGDISALEKVINTSPTVINHNIETVESIYEKLRPQSDYNRSLELLSNVKHKNDSIYTKSGIMLGLGETHIEILTTFDQLLDSNCDFLTIGQYLAPSKSHYPVHEYITPDKFEQYAELAQKKGFRYVASAPFVRSSYNAYSAISSVPASNSGSTTSCSSDSCGSSDSGCESSKLSSSS